MGIFYFFGSMIHNKSRLILILMQSNIVNDGYSSSDESVTSIRSIRRNEGNTFTAWARTASDAF